MKLRVNRFLMTSILALTMGVLLGGCEKQTDFTAEQMTIFGQIEALKAADSAPSRAQASDRTAFGEGNKIGVWVVPYKVTGGTGEAAAELRGEDNYKDNIEHTNAIVGGFTGEVINYPNSTVKVDVYAVAPYDAAMSTMTDPIAYDFSITPNQSAAEGIDVLASDFLTAKNVGQATTSSGAVELEFKHRLTRVVVGFTTPAKYKNATVTGVAGVKFLGMQLKSVINIADQTANATPATEANPEVDIDMYKAEETAITGGAGGTKYIYEAIVVPGKLVNLNDDVVEISLNVEGLGEVAFLAQSSGVTTAEGSTQDSFTYMSGSQYNITANLGDDPQIKLSNVTIVPWGTEITVTASTTKLHAMNFDCEIGNAASVNKTAKKATLVIQGVTYTNCDVTYNGTDTKGVYTVKYDAKVNFGGYLQGFTFYGEDGTTVLFQKASGISKQIKGNPADDNYAEKIGKITFNSGNTIAFE